MKAAQIAAYGGPDVIEIVDLPTPEPGEGEVLVRAAAIGLVWDRHGRLLTVARPDPPFEPALPGGEMLGVSGCDNPCALKEALTNGMTLLDCRGHKLPQYDQSMAVFRTGANDQ